MSHRTILRFYGLHHVTILKHSVFKLGDYQYRREFVFVQEEFYRISNLLTRLLIRPNSDMSNNRIKKIISLPKNSIFHRDRCNSAENASCCVLKSFRFFHLRGTLLSIETFHCKPAWKCIGLQISERNRIIFLCCLPKHYITRNTFNLLHKITFDI